MKGRLTVVLGLAGMAAAAVVVAAPSAVGTRDPRSPRLRLVAADVSQATALLLTKADLGKGFRAFDTGTSQANDHSACMRRIGPDLSRLTETAEVFGEGLSNNYTGVHYVPSVYVFSSAAEAARAQALLTGPRAVTCGVETVKSRLEPVLASARQNGQVGAYTGESMTYVARRVDGVTVRARQAVLGVKVDRFKFRAEASVIFLRRGRALAEVATNGDWDAGSRRVWNEAVTAVAQHLSRSRF